MIRIGREEECCGCAACASACPVKCIEMRPTAEGFLYPHADPAHCIDCGKCERACPFLGDESTTQVRRAYAAYSLDETVRVASSSGGVFTELARPMLARGGVVYGVAMDADCRGCSFVRAEDDESLAPLRGSKYLQAESQGVWKCVEKDLGTGRRVLFTGTPCQTNALPHYLGGRRDGILIVDFVCHGVPSPRLWAECVASVEKREGMRVESVNFRCKDIGWRRFGLKERCGVHVRFWPLDKSPYLRMFLRDYCLRPSCYECKAKENRSSDLTIADFWGVERVAPQMSDELGCSLVIVRTERGAEAIKAISNNLRILEVSYADAVNENPVEFRSVVRPPERDAFFIDLDKFGYADVARKYGALGTGAKIRSFMKTILRPFIGGGTMNKMRYGVLMTLRPTKEDFSSAEENG